MHEYSAFPCVPALSAARLDQCELFCQKSPTRSRHAPRHGAARARFDVRHIHGTYLLTWGHRGGQSRVCGGSRVGSTQQRARVRCWGQRRVARDLVTRRVVQTTVRGKRTQIREGQSGATGPGVVGTRCTQGHRSMGSNPRCRCPLDRGRTAVTRVWGFAGETWVAG